MVILTFKVASLISSTRVWSLRSSWWLPLEFVNISTPSRPMRICGLERGSVNYIERQIHNLPCRSKQLLTQFDTDASVDCTHDSVTKRHFYLE